ncbi:MAG: mono/diheme cytochrome c family protein [Rhodothermales bacterium]|jgi:mono/diheme cytochrome c family protein
MKEHIQRLDCAATWGKPSCRNLRRLLICALFFAIGAAAEVDFNRDIRPILSDNCFYCHGPDEETREADLRIDIREAAIADLGGYAAIVPGKPEESELYLRITNHGEDIMPPVKAKKILSAEQRKLIHDWIAEGAEYAGHWAFEPLKVGEPPAKVHPIDHFIHRKLEGIRPSQEAEREVLIRRAYLDVVGLLPEPEAVAAFLADDSPDAWKNLVDELLASPHYGERWGRHWLDQARYADSHGYSADSARQMWPFRDWVIRAINDDMPFDQFTIEQLAGDLLEKPDKLQLIASAFHRNTLINQEGGSDPEQFRVEAVIDRVNTTGAVWLGLTVGCAQCHTHKFDPIPQDEFYSLFAFFNSGTDRNNAGKTISVHQGEVFESATSDAERQDLQAKWEAKEVARLAGKIEDASVETPNWAQAKPSKAWTSSKHPLQILDDQSLLIGKLGANDKFYVETTPSLETIRSIRLRPLTHKTLPQNGPGQAGNGNFVLTGFEILSKGKAQPMASVYADHAQDGYPVTAVIDGNRGTGWAINTSKATPKIAMNTDHEAVFTLKEPLQVDGVLEIRLLHQRNPNYHLGHFAIDFSAQVSEKAVAGERRLLDALQVAAAKRSDAQKRLVESRYVADQPRAKRPKTAEAKLMVMQDHAKPRDTYLLTRGDFTRPDRERGKLHPGGLSAVRPALPPEASRNRLDLARWLIHPENPLTARVTMNRTWMRYFGRGLVETEEDFGTQGSPPTHPDLLDWLAHSFIKNGWSMKAMHRLILTSATYRQSSHARPDLSDTDARNFLLARQNRLRVDAEIVRDAALCAGGLLTPEIGGPSVFPPQPDGIYSFTQNRKSWKTSSGPDRFRRAMYTMFYRSAPHPLFTTFDAPDFSSVCTRRVRSNTPLQALTVANDPAFMEFAQGLAKRMGSKQTLDDQIRHGFQLALGRPPAAVEMAALQTFAEQQLEAFATNKKATATFVGKMLPADAESASLVSIARAILNTDNFITRE